MNVDPFDACEAEIASLAIKIDAVLPQTQCTRCGYDDCAAYALAIAKGEAEINQCPPGGQEGIARIAAVTKRPVIPLNPEYGVESVRWVAIIDEAWCIGCTQCIPACPTDAIVGASKVMHTVMATHCTGCELCLPTCPVDCIKMENASDQATGWAAWSQQQAQSAKERYAKHQIRRDSEKDLSPAHKKTALQVDVARINETLPVAGMSSLAHTESAKQATINAVLQKARERKTVAKPAP
jgi:Na+-translocating ferredoxin:NAD+ oxidoreductase subunit B